MTDTGELIVVPGFQILVDDLEGGTRVYPVDGFIVDVHRARLLPVFNGGQTVRDFSSFASFRLVHPDHAPDWLVNSLSRL